jgi:5-methylcytosine-specific restriction endonuclease McrA
MKSSFALYQAQPHQWGAGKTHAIDPDDLSRTMCGKALASTPGHRVASGQGNCKSCATSIESRQDRARLQLEYETQQRVRDLERANDDKAWWARYNAYLRSEKWTAIRALIMKRAGGMCEGCLTRRAVQVHHLTYAHVCDEFMWELRAVCNECHERFHDTAGDVVGDAMALARRARLR